MFLEKIIGCCEAVRAALSDLLNDYMTGAKTGEKMDVQSAIDNLVSRNRELYGHLRRAAGDQLGSEWNFWDLLVEDCCKTHQQDIKFWALEKIGDTFLNPNVPILYIYGAARNGEVENVKEYSGVFVDHAERLVEAAKVE